MLDMSVRNHRRGPDVLGKRISPPFGGLILRGEGRHSLTGTTSNGRIMSLSSCSSMWQ